MATRLARLTHGQARRNLGGAPTLRGVQGDALLRHQQPLMLTVVIQHQVAVRFFIPAQHLTPHQLARACRAVAERITS